MTALDVYRRCGIRRLPVDPARMARSLSIPLLTYDQYCRATQTDMLSLLRSENPDAFTQISLGGRPSVVYNRQRPPGRRRWSVVHELSHILLGHFDGAAAPDQRLDAPADRFAAELLCPTPVVSLCGVRTARELQELCGLSHEASLIRWDELCAFRRGERGAWGEDDLSLIAYFQTFIGAVLDGFSPQSTTPPVL